MAGQHKHKFSSSQALKLSIIGFLGVVSSALCMILGLIPKFASDGGRSVSTVSSIETTSEIQTSPSFNLGVLPLGHDIELFFSTKTFGLTPSQIGSIQTSCDCLAVDLIPLIGDVPPNPSMRCESLVRLRMHAERKEDSNGPVSQRLRIECKIQMPLEAFKKFFVDVELLNVPLPFQEWKQDVVSSQ